ncbi:unnamed protein product [Rodentolepis nana]|uniref:Family with sequence similarity 189 member A1 n=1 Tax=Rodentolepis nana TaxID=102285 RepID=A0A0R3SZU8_RODNA|nr:unnamed protein product [Rodentolepis nana]
MNPNSEGQYDLPLLRPLRPPTVCLPSIVESIATENSLTHETTSQHDFRPTPSRNNKFRICRRLKRLITNKNSSTTSRPYHPTNTEPRICDDAPNTTDQSRSCCCLPRPKCSRLQHFCSSFSSTLGRLTGRRMPNENLFVLSMIQLLCGLAAVVLSGVAVTKVVFLYQMATGLWSGFLMLATGFHGIVTARRCTPRTLVSLLIFCVLVALSACLLACVSVAGLIEDGILRPETSFTLLSSNSPYYITSHSSISSNGLSVDIPLGGFSHRRVIASNQPPRLHQVMLHVLLLVIGILEASVSVACAVLCCRQICPPDSTPPLSAISYLQNRGATLIPGGSDFLLAVAAEPGRPAPLLLDYPLPPADLHPSVHHFLPRPGRRVVILTQAETGIHALAAAQAVASLVSPSQNSLCPNPTSSSQRVQKREESHQLKTHLSTFLPQLANGNDSEFRSAHPSSLLYVLSSPSPTDAPMIFPPFPPAYCAEEDTSIRMHPQAFNIGPHSDPPESVTLGRRSRRRHVGRRSGREILGPRQFLNQRRARRGGSSAETAVGLLGDRILQPVLVVEDDSNSQMSAQNGSRNNPPPPSYTRELRPLPPTPEEN